MFSLFKREKLLKKYYREYTGAWGWGVMEAYDTVWAHSRKKAIQKSMRSRYGRDNKAALDFIVEVPKSELNLTDEELSKIYGAKDD
jgi:hypothetical protein